MGLESSLDHVDTRTGIGNLVPRHGNAGLWMHPKHLRHIHVDLRHILGVLIHKISVGPGTSQVDNWDNI